MPRSSELEKALAKGTENVNQMEGLFPAKSLLTGAMVIGATLQSSEATLGDLPQEVQEIRDLLKVSPDSKILTKALEVKEKELQSLLKPQDEANFQKPIEVKLKIEKVLSSIEEQHLIISDEILAMKENVKQAYSLFTDKGYEDGIEKLHAAYKHSIQKKLQYMSI